MSETPRGFSPIQAALSLAEEFGLPVFPCGADKKPRTTSGFKDASRNIEQIGEWFDLHDDVLVAVPTGKASNLLVVDIDPIGSNWYAENQGRLGAGRVHKTRRGHHLLYKMPAAEIRNSAGKLAPGVDVRAEGGYVIWWPAHGLEAIGDLSDVTEPPAWLIDALSARVGTKVIPLNGSAHPEGGRNDALTRLGGKLRRDGLNDIELEAALLAANRQRCNPPLADDEVRGVAQSVARYEPAKEPDAPEPWPDPVNILGEMGAPEFTSDEVPAVLSDFALAYAKSTGFDPSLTLSAAVSVAAAALSDGFQIVGDSRSQWFQQPRLWVLGIGRPGTGKTPVQKAMLGPLWAIQKAMIEAHDLAVATLPEGEKPPPIPRVIIGDVTIEALSERLRGNPRGILIANDEFESWLGSHDTYRSGAVSRDRGEWLRLFDGGPHTIERIQRGSVFIENWGASILTATTPAALAKLTRALPEDGLLQRFIPIIARRKGEAQAVATLDDARARYGHTIERLFAATPRAHKGCVPLSGDAQEFLQAWLKQNQLAQEAFGAMEPALEAHLAKYPSFILRLALTFHAANIMNQEHELARDPAAFPVSLATIQTAARFLKRATLHAVAIYLDRKSGSDVYELARDVARAILARAWTQVARRDLIQGVRCFRKASDQLQDSVLRLFVDLGWLRYAEGGYQKATPARYEVNPGLAAKFAAVAQRERERRAVIREVIAQTVQDARQADE
jgi:hypothetical protein